MTVKESVMKMAAEGVPTKDIAATLGVSVPLVYYHRRRGGVHRRAGRPAGAVNAITREDAVRYLTARKGMA